MLNYRSKGNLPLNANYYALLNRRGVKASDINILDSGIYATVALNLNYDLTHSYFDKSNTDIWEDFIRNSINYDSENTNRWNVDELSQDYLDKHIKPAYRNKIYCGLGSEDDDYRGAIMVFEAGMSEELLRELRFWRKRKYFNPNRNTDWVKITAPVASSEFAIDIAFDVEGESTSSFVIIEAQDNDLNWKDITVATGEVAVISGAFSASCKFTEALGFTAGNSYPIRVRNSLNTDVFDIVLVTVESSIPEDVDEFEMVAHATKEDVVVIAHESEHTLGQAEITKEDLVVIVEPSDFTMETTISKEDTPT